MRTIPVFILFCLLVKSVNGQWLGYSTPYYIFPDVGTGAPAWRAYATNATWTLWDDVNQRVGIKVRSSDGGIVFRDGTVQTSASSGSTSGASSVFSVTTYGATGDGVTDDTSSIQAAIAASTNSIGGGMVFFPSGKYRITSTLRAPGAVFYMQGSGIRPILWPDYNASGRVMNGTAIIMDGTNIPIIAIEGPGDHISNMTIMYAKQRPASETLSACLITSTNLTFQGCYEYLNFANGAYCLLGQGPFFANVCNNWSCLTCSHTFVSDYSGGQEANYANLWYMQNQTFDKKIVVDAANISRAGAVLTINYGTNTLPDTAATGVLLTPSGYGPSAYTSDGWFITNIDTASKTITLTMDSDPGVDPTNLYSFPGGWFFRSDSMYGPAFDLKAEWQIGSITAELTVLTNEPTVFRTFQFNHSFQHAHVEFVGFGTNVGTPAIFRNKALGVQVGSVTMQSCWVSKPAQGLYLASEEYNTGRTTILAGSLAGNHLEGYFNLGITNGSGGTVIVDWPSFATNSVAARANSSYTYSGYGHAYRLATTGSP